ncbi:hypothetical protein [Thiomicrospira microaerophila]|uniref:hypothetical protein n=1 Tax=Thiomicrospira microaerophila TaxID=406020 RepID=UPI0005C809B1|nr:hypothetical protein [Thiomicrospira microaerophila]
MLKPIKTERISPVEFKRLAQDNNISGAKFIAPQVGDGTFGSFEITYRTPVLKQVSSNPYSIEVERYVNH